MNKYGDILTFTKTYLSLRYSSSVNETRLNPRCTGIQEHSSCASNVLSAMLLILILLEGDLQL
jgi:hypothetical protein